MIHTRLLSRFSTLPFVSLSFTCSNTLKHTLFAHPTIQKTAFNLNHYNHYNINNIGKKQLFCTSTPNSVNSASNNSSSDNPNNNNNNNSHFNENKGRFFAFLKLLLNEKETNLPQNESKFKYLVILLIVGTQVLFTALIMNELITKTKDKNFTNVQQVLGLRKVSCDFADIYGYLMHYNGINQLVKSLGNPITPPKTRAKVIKMLFELGYTHEELLDFLQKDLIKTGSIHRLFDALEKQGEDEVYILFLLNRLLDYNSGKSDFAAEVQSAVFQHRTLISKIMKEIDDHSVVGIPRQLLHKTNKRLLQQFREEMYVEFAASAFNRQKLSNIGYKIPNLIVLLTPDSLSIRIPSTNFSVPIPHVDLEKVLIIAFAWSVTRAMRPFVPRLWKRSMKFSELPFGSLLRCGLRTTLATGYCFSSIDILTRVNKFTQSNMHSKNQIVVTSVTLQAIDVLLGAFLLSRASFWIFPFLVNLKWFLV